jgi:hypothetical protein
MEVIDDCTVFFLGILPRTLMPTHKSSSPSSPFPLEHTRFLNVQCSGFMIYTSGLEVVLPLKQRKKQKFSGGFRGVSALESEVSESAEVGPVSSQ